MILSEGITTITLVSNSVLLLEVDKAFLNLTILFVLMSSIHFKDYPT